MKINYYSALQESQKAYRKAAVYEVFLELKLNILLIKPLSLKKIAHILKLNIDALNRFLHATCALELTNKLSNCKFQTNINFSSYSNLNSLTLFWLFENKIPDLLTEPKTLTQISKLAKLKSTDKNHLDNAVYFNLLKINKSNKKYSIPTVTKKYLLSNSDNYIGNRIKHFERIMFPMFSKTGLIASLKTGQTQWSMLTDKEASNPFKLYKSQPELLEFFTNGMHQLNLDDDQIILNSLKLTKINSVLDVGGGSGAFALELLKIFKNIQNVDIYELNEAIPIMTKILRQYSNKPESKIQYVSGSFLKKTKYGNLFGLDKNKKYDLIILGWILHDWNDKTVQQILKRVTKHLASKGNLLILESILPDTKISEISLADLAMLLQTEGRERTLTEFKDLLHSSGYKFISTTKLPTKRQAILAQLRVNQDASL